MSYRRLQRSSLLKRVSLALLLVMLVCVGPRLRRPTLSIFPADFNVYYCASMLVHRGQAAALYQGADTGTDPQKALAPSQSLLFTVAKEQGLSFVGLYVYPPVLADLMLPLTFTSLATATHLWLLVGGLFLLCTALLVLRLLRLPLLSWQAALIVLATLCFTPALQCLVDGQITIFLLLLWTLGTLLYRERSEAASGAVFALATAIKLTPALVLLPFLLWRKWRVLGAFSLSLAFLAAFSLWLDTPGALGTYVTRVLPAMSGALPVVSNYSLPASTQRLLLLLYTGAVPAAPADMPPHFVLAGRAASALAALVLAPLLAKRRIARSHSEQVLVLAVMSLLAPVLSPVSWFHAYSTAFLAFAVLWFECFRRPPPTPYLLTLTAVSLLLGSAVAENLIPLLLFSGHDVLSTALHFGELIAALGLVFYRLAAGPAAQAERPPEATSA